MVNYFICPCLFDIVFASNDDDISELIKFLSVNYLILEYDRSFYISCKDSIDFYSEYNKDSDSCYSSTEPISCLDLICYGFEDVCSKCEKIILNYFSDHLSKIEK